jgi:hypothetical protein
VCDRNPHTSMAACDGSAANELSPKSQWTHKILGVKNFL